MKITIGMKLTMGFMVILIMMGAMGIVAYSSLKDIKGDADKILLYSHKFEMVNGLKQMISVFLNLNDSLLTGHLQSRDYYNSLNLDIEKRLLYVGKLRLNENELGLIKGLEEKFILIKEKSEKYLKLPNPGEDTKTDDLIGEINIAKWVIINKISGLYEEAWRSLDEAVIMAHETEKKGWLSIRVISAIAIILGLGIGILLTRTIGKPIRSLTSITKIIAKGDLNQRIETSSRDEIGELVSSFNTMIKDLRESRERAEQRDKELKETQAKLIQSEKLALMGHMAAGIGHELRNTIGVIKNAAYYLKSGIGDDSRLNRHIAIIERELISSDRIINDLLHFSRPIELNLTLIDINKVAEEALSATEAPPKVRTTKELDPQLPKTMADGDHIRRIFINIILNAYQSMPDGGELRITSRGEEGFIKVGFTDTGIGISEENLRRLFEPFFTTKVKGIGLGLTVSRKMIEGHRGRIDVRSETGKGTTFTIILPIEYNESLPHYKHGVGIDKKGLEANILLVDDQVGMVETLSDILKERGYNITIANDGREAIERAKETQFSLALIDIKLPGINGVETFKEIKKINPEIAVIMMTAYSVDDLIRESIAEGAYATIYKPFDPERILKIIEDVIEKRPKPAGDYHG